MSVPDDVIEKRAEAIYATWSYDPAFVPWTPHGNSLMQDKAHQQARLELADALSALEAAGWEVNRKGTREALALAAERLAVAASRIDRADTEFGFRMWADEARNVAGRAVVDLTAEPQFRVTLSEEARAEIERLERANAAAAANLGNILIGSASKRAKHDR